MTTLTDFLLARIAEDEAAFEIAVATEVASARRDGIPDMTAQEVRDYWLRPAGDTGDRVADSRTEWPRLLAECEAKRRIIGLKAQPSDIYTAGGFTTDEILRALAAVYADHPDYQAEWAIA